MSELLKNMHDKTFKKQMTQAHLNYCTKAIHPPPSFSEELIAKYTPLKVPQGQKNKDQKQQKTFAYYLIYGPLFPTPTTPIVLYNYWKYIFGLQANTPYFIIFFASDVYECFRNIFLELPLPFHVNLIQMVVIRPNLYQRLIDYLPLEFSVLGRHLRTKTDLMPSVGAFCQKYHVDKEEFISFLPSTLALGKECMTSFVVDVQMNRMNVLEHKKSDSMRQEKIAFEQQFSKHLSKVPQFITEYDLGNVVPKALEILICYIKRQPQMLEIEGIFRKSVAIDESQDCFNKIVLGNYASIESVTNPYLIANYIKRFFHNLHIPIINYRIFGSLMQIEGYEQIERIPRVCTLIRQILLGMQELNYVTLMYLFEFLVEDVLPRARQNLMNAKNLGIVFAPSLMHAEVVSMEDIAWAVKSAIIVQIILQHHVQVFGTKEVRMEVYRKAHQSGRTKLRNSLKNNLQLLHDPPSFHTFEPEQNSRLINKSTKSKLCALQQKKNVPYILQASNSHCQHSYIAPSQINYNIIQANDKLVPDL